MLTGQAVGPSMFEVFEIMGRERSANRLRSGVPALRGEVLLLNELVI